MSIWTKERHEAAKSREKAATPEPWEWIREDHVSHEHPTCLVAEPSHLRPTREMIVVLQPTPDGWLELSEEDENFLSHSRTDNHDMLDEIERLQRIVEASTDNQRALWSALHQIRDAVETVGLVGCLPAEEHLTNPEPETEADAICAAIAENAQARQLVRLLATRTCECETTSNPCAPCLCDDLYDDI